MDHKNLILGELREFKRATLERLAVIEKKVDSHYQFRAKLIGAAGGASMLVTALIEFLKHINS